jgi:hypothetical protein
LQLSVQLPTDHDDAARVVGLLIDVMEWRSGKPSGREERQRRFRLIAGAN